MKKILRKAIPILLSLVLFTSAINIAAISIDEQTKNTFDEIISIEDPAYQERAMEMSRFFQNEIDLNTLEFNFDKAVQDVQQSSGMVLDKVLNQTIEKSSPQTAEMMNELAGHLRTMGVTISQEKKDAYSNIIANTFSNLERDKEDWIIWSKEKRRSRAYTYNLLFAFKDESAKNKLIVVPVGLTVSVYTVEEKLLFITIKDKDYYNVNVKALRVITDCKPQIPTFNPDGGSYISPQTVTINCATDNITIRYTTDGTTPTTSSPIFERPILLTRDNMTIKSIAVTGLGVVSKVGVAEFTRDKTKDRNVRGANILSEKIKAIAGGTNTIALKEDGTVVAWGDNTYGQCNVPVGLTNVWTIAGGKSHAIALKEDGTVIAWGDNSRGQCKVPSGINNVKAIGAGKYHTIALKEDGTVIAWGDNSNGQCNIPEGLTNVRSIAGGSSHTIALKEGGTVVAWGDNTFGQCNVPEGLVSIKAIAGGSSHTIALKEDGTVVVWGDNSKGQCNVPEELANIKAIAGGNCHTLALKEDGTVIAWGDNSDGQCTIPEILTNVKEIESGDNHTIVLKEDETVAAWGNNLYGQCNVPREFVNIKLVAVGKYSTIIMKEDGTLLEPDSFNGKYNVPEGRTNTRSIARGDFHTVALKEDGTVAAWGSNSESQCNVPAGLKNVKAIDAGVSHTVALKEDGTVVAWGYNSEGRCNVPEWLVNVKEIAAGGFHTVALRENGMVTAWGGNSEGQCNIPAGLTNVIAIDAGISHTVALMENGSVAAWGNNLYGQCNVPAELKYIKAISAGTYHTVALKYDGTVVAWGQNSEGQCNVPMGLTNVKAIAAGISHTVAMREDGTIVIWGKQYLDFSKLISTSPVEPAKTHRTILTVASSKTATPTATPTPTPTATPTPTLTPITPSISIISPKTDVTYILGQEVTIQAKGLGCKRMTAYVNDRKLSEMPGENYSDNFKLTQAGSYNIDIIGLNDSGIEAARSALIINVIGPNSLTTQTSGAKEIKLKIGNSSMIVDGIEKAVDPGRDTKPIIVSNRTLVPLRSIVEELGGKVEWYSNTQTIVLKLNNYVCEMKINSKQGALNGLTFSMDVEPKIINNRTFLPIRYIEKIGCEIDWDQKSQSITVKRL